MNDIISKFLLAGGKFKPEMHLRQPGFTYSACEPFNKNKEEKKKETGYSRYIYQNELGKACFKHGMTYGDFKDLNIRTAAEKVLRDKSSDIAKNQKYDGYQRGLALMVYNIFDKKTSGGTVKNENISDKN